MFIEDWWYEIATKMSKDSETYDRIDEDVLEYVKNMRIGSVRIKFEWLRLKIKIIKYFKALNTVDEESKDDEKYDTSTKL